MADNENYEPVTTEPDSELGKMLYALNGNPVDVPYPTSEFTTILYALLGYAIEVPEPTSEASRLLYQYYIEGGGGSGDYQAKNIEPDFSNGNVVVIPDSEYDALSRVVIEKDADLLASNIKKDVEIFGITGTLENTVPQDLQTDMNSVFNEKFQTSIDYPPEEWAATVELMEPYPTETTSGSVANFSTSLTLPLVSHNVTIEPVQEGAGDPSPSNPRPISGWNAVTISHSGADTSEAKEIEIPLGQTVYGGTLDVTSGVLKVTYGFVDLSTLNWSTDANTHRATSYSLTSQIKKPAHASQQPQSIAEEWKLANYGTTLQQGTMTIYSDGRLIAYYDGEAPSGNFCYELATPVEITLTPEQINTLKGVNNIWADTGDTAVEFKLTHQDWVDQHTSPDPNLLTKSAPEEVKEETEEVDTDNR